ncbi:MAG: HPr family phosphocarrier protein [Acidobacteriota bacterium]|nr:MAG: HPr family phosphocarrier protein [Acidobacteriota bacterium]
MIKGRVKIVNRLGLHARAAALVVKRAAEFESSVMLIREDSSIFADAKSILSVLSLAASNGMELAIEVEGPDEESAFASMTKLFEEGFGEL